MKKITQLLLFVLMSINLIAGYALTTNQQSSPSLPMGYSTASVISVKGWANEAFMAAYSYDFVKYDEQLLQASKYFTPEAWKNFKSSLDKSGTIQLIKNKQLISVGLAEGTGPVILQQGTVNGVYTWLVRFPAVITYQGANSVEKVQHFMVNMTISSTNGKEGVRGMIIQKMDITSLSQNISPTSAPSRILPEYEKALETAVPQSVAR